MKTVTVKANAKINLCLDVVGKRSNGYHDIKSIFSSVGLCDHLTVTKIKEKGVIIKTNSKFVPRDGRNVITKAYEAFFNEVDTEKFGVEVILKKEIPIQAGLGGGSADAAGMLVVLNILSEKNLTEEELCKIGERVGADVPFCVKGGMCLVEGIGEKLTPIECSARPYIVIVKPKCGISTRNAYYQIDKNNKRIENRIHVLVDKIQKGDLEENYRNLYNIFEEVTSKKEILEVKKRLLDANAKNALMTGSGSAVFGIFEDYKTADKIAQEIAYDENKTVFLTTFSAKGVEIIK